MDKYEKITLTVAHIIGLGAGVGAQLANLESGVSIVVGVTSTLYVLIISSHYGLRTDIAKVIRELDKRTSDLERTHQSIEDALVSVEEVIDEVSVIARLHERLEDVPHPYFAYIARRKLESFIANNERLLRGTYFTSPTEEETFGIKGLSYTRENGIVRNLSTIRDYWEDPRNWSDHELPEYLATQKFLIEQRNATVERIFVFKSNEQESYEGVMEKQARLGIEVWYIHSDQSEPLSHSWLKEDYQIQDDRLLVELIFEDGVDRQLEAATERVTAEPRMVKEKLERYRQIKERATKVVL